MSIDVFLLQAVYAGGRTLNKMIVITVALVMVAPLLSLPRNVPSVTSHPPITEQSRDSVPTPTTVYSFLQHGLAW